MFHIIPATVPETPHHCHVANQTLVGIRVVCDSGFDGGLEQTFHMEVLSLADNIMYGNRSRDVPSFWAGQLPAGEKIYIRLYASNSKGRSTPVILQAETSLAAGVGYPIKHEREIAEEGFSILLVLLLGTILTIILMGVVVGLVMRCSEANRHRHRTLNRGSDNGFETLQRKDFRQDPHGSSCQYQTSVFQDNRVSPDVIPDSFTHVNKCQDFGATLSNPKQKSGCEGGYLGNGRGRVLHTPDGSDSSGFSEKAASSEFSCSDYCSNGGVQDNRLLAGLGTGQGYNERNIREQSSKVFPSELELMTMPAKPGPLNDCPYSTMPRMPGPGAVDKCLTPTLVSGSASLARRQRLASPGSLQLQLGDRGRALRPEPLLRPLNECEDSLGGLVSARTPLIEADSDRESCV